MKVVILRDLAEERRLSMERFADEIIGAFRHGDAVQPVPLTVNPRLSTSRFRRLGTASARAARFGEYPIRATVAAKRWDADVFHIIDHGYAEKLRDLPDFRAPGLKEAAAIILAET